MISYDQIKAKCTDVHEYSNYFSCICPFHEDNAPSLMVYKDGWFRCLACGVSGQYKRLWNKLRGWGVSPSQEETAWSPVTTSLNLAEQERFCDEAHQTLSNFIESLGWYLESRGVLGRLEACRLGYNKGWYTIPIYNKSHEFEGYVMRASLAIQKATGRRFHMPKGQPALMYVPDWNLLEKSNYIVIVYGMFDALALAELRIPVATTTAGKLSFKSEWLEDYRKPIYVLPDKGEEDTGAELANSLGWRGRLLPFVYPEGFKDPAQMLEKGQAMKLAGQIYSTAGLAT